MDRLVEQVVIDILKNQMGFKDDQIWIRDQDKVIPNDKGFYAVVGSIGPVPFSASSSIEYRNDENGGRSMIEVTSSNCRETIQVDVFSRSNEAIRRRWELVPALASIFSRQMQEKERFKIARIPSSFINTSAAEGGSRINRYSLSFACLVWYRKERVIDPSSGEYYDDFDTRVDDEKTIGTSQGLIEFNIKAEE